MFLRDAERHYKEGVYWLTCFEALQAAKLYVEALLVALTASHLYTHDLADLILQATEAAGVEAPRNLLDYADALTPHYTMARYPGRKPVVYDAGRAERCIAQARAIVEWVRSIADP